jgi:hypothetical protein
VHALEVRVELDETGSDIATSSSPIAAATHVASLRLASSGRSALTTPPAPRWAVKVPSSLRSNRNGPRFETTSTR